MKYSVEVRGNYAMVSLKDKIYISDASLLRDDLLKILSQGVTDLRMDLSRLTYIDCSGIGTLVTINKLTEGRVVLIGAQGLPLDLFKRTRLDRVFKIE